jgi:hypothetical protein
MTIKFLALFLLVFGYFQKTTACTFIKHGETTMEEIEYYIKSSSEIYVGKAIRQKGKYVVFSIVEKIKGPEKSEINFEGKIDPKASDETFSGHRSDSHFWKSKYIGRIADNGTCEFKATFRKDVDYIIFKSNPLNFKAAEIYAGPEDSWYLKVKRVSTSTKK